MRFVSGNINHFKVIFKREDWIRREMPSRKRTKLGLVFSGLALLAYGGCTLLGGAAGNAPAAVREPAARSEEAQAPLPSGWQEPWQRGAAPSEERLPAQEEYAAKALSLLPIVSSGPVGAVPGASAAGEVAPASQEAPSKFAYSGQVVYCGTNREDLFAPYYPDEFAASGSPTGLEWPSCVRGPAPPGTKLLPIRFVSQVAYGGEIADYGCGPASFKMASDFVLGEDSNIFAVFETLHTTKAGTGMDVMRDEAERRGIFLSYSLAMPFEDIDAHISQGHPIIFKIRQDFVEPERYCLNKCNNMQGHYVVIGGTYNTGTSYGVILFDPATGADPSRGEASVMSFPGLQEIYSLNGSQDFGRGLVLGLDADGK